MRSQTANVPNRSNVYRAEEAVFGIELWLCLQNIIERKALRVKHDKMANQEFSKYELMPWHAMLHAKVIDSSGKPNLSTGIISKCVVGRMNTYGGEGPRSPIFVSSDTTDSDEFWQEGEETEDDKEVDGEDTISIHEMGPDAYADTPSPNSDSSARWSTETLFNGPQNQFFTPRNLKGENVVWETWPFTDPEQRPSVSPISKAESVSEESYTDEESEIDEAADQCMDETPHWEAPPTPVIETLVQPFAVWEDDPFEELEWNITRNEAEELLRDGGFRKAVEKAFRLVSRKKHPDRNDDADAKYLFHRITEAKAGLLNRRLLRFLIAEFL